MKTISIALIYGNSKLNFSTNLLFVLKSVPSKYNFVIMFTGKGISRVFDHIELVERSHSKVHRSKYKENNDNIYYNYNQ